MRNKQKTLIILLLIIILALFSALVIGIVIKNTSRNKSYEQTTEEHYVAINGQNNDKNSTNVENTTTSVQVEQSDSIKNKIENIDILSEAQQQNIDSMYSLVSKHYKTDINSINIIYSDDKITDIKINDEEEYVLMLLHNKYVSCYDKETYLHDSQGLNGMAQGVAEENDKNE